MNNLVIGLKRFFTNKNVVTIILVLVALALLFWGYTSTIKKETNPINVPVAAVKINPKTKITQDMVSYKSVAGSMVDSNVIRNSHQLIDRYTDINVTVPVGGMFYTECIVDKSDIPGQWVEELDREKELPFYMSVSVESTIGNSVLPNSYIDFYMRATDENGVMMLGRFMKDVNVLVVHDSQGQDVFQDTEAIGSPAKIGFAVSQDYYLLLTKIKYLNVELIIVPRGSKAPECTGECMIVTSSTLRDFVDAQTITVEEDVIVEEVKEEEKAQQDQNGGQTQNPTPAQQ